VAKLEFIKIAGVKILPAKEPEPGVFTMAHIRFGIGIVKIAI
jgi:hypothetical protein